MIITHAFKSDSGSNFKGNCRKELTRVYENLPPADLCFMCQKTPEKVQLIEDFSKVPIFCEVKCPSKKIAS